MVFNQKIVAFHSVETITLDFASRIRTQTNRHTGDITGDITGPPTFSRRAMPVQAGINHLHHGAHV